MEKKPSLTLIRGLPGSGKSTLGAKLAVASNGVLLEADQYFVNESGEYHWDQNHLFEAHEWCRDKTTHFLRQGTAVFVANTFTTHRELYPYFEIAREFEIVPSVILMQNTWGSIHGIPQEAYLRMKKRFQYDIDFLLKEKNERNID